jgi:hypothetical protein
MKGFFAMIFVGLMATAVGQTVDTLKMQDPLIIRDSAETTILLQEVNLVPLPDFQSIDERNAYYLLRRRVLKVYPYAKLARETLDGVDEELEGIRKRRKQKKYAKQVEKDLRLIFEDKLRKLTRSEGKILMKLIHRETGETAYDIAKRMRGGFSAVFYQTIAKIYDSDMKSEYDPDAIDQDAMIENILQRAFAAGVLEE